MTVVAAPSERTPGTTTTTKRTTPSGKIFPDANISYPNGAIVRSEGKKIHLCRGKGLCRRELLGSNGKGRPRQDPGLPAGVVLPVTASLRPRTPLSTRPINGHPTIYVAGTDGEFHGFSTSRQFSRDG